MRKKKKHGLKNLEVNLVSYNRIRGLIITLGSFTVIAALAVQSQILAFALVTLLSLAAMVTLYLNMETIVDMDHESPRFALLKKLSVAGFLYFMLCIAAGLLVISGVVSPQGSEWIAPILICIFMIGFGNLSPKVPYNKFLGLRLPWTLLDEQTWIVAHRVLCYLSFPLSFIYIALIPYVKDVKALTFCIFVVLWIGLSALISGVFFLRKFFPHRK